ncbi:MAG: NAD(P)-dependent glycerol-3-phosphate dehydrogenase [Alphaproteobacteria bacterium]|nr:NAD(P)-dependent glycerol-3-phosphate dehydrogenase [Alphaproteobacteria bacterium]
MKRVAIIGGGAWGTALATVARRSGAAVKLWARDAAIVDAINRRHENPVYLPQVPLDPAIVATSDPVLATEGAEGVLLVVPAQHLRGVIDRFAAVLRAGLSILICAKGIETRSLLTMSEVVTQSLPGRPLGILSGPSFAAEVACDLPTAVTIACRDAALGQSYLELLAAGRFRPYLSSDTTGVEIGGAIKNVLAIACGVVAGRGLGDNARAALITRGLAEMTRFGVARGARAETFAGLSGLGDLVLTCNAAQSRNYRLGLALGRGESLGTALRAAERSVVEGVATAAAVAELAGRLGVEMPVCEAVDAVLHRAAAVSQAVDGLLSRPYRNE